MNGAHGLASGKASPCPARWAFGFGWQWQGVKTSTGCKVTMLRWSSPPTPEEEFQDQGGGSSGALTFELVMASGSHGNRQCQIWVGSALAVVSTVQLPCCSPDRCSGQSSALPSCTPWCGVGKRVQKLGGWGGPRTRRGTWPGSGSSFLCWEEDLVRHRIHAVSGGGVRLRIRGVSERDWEVVLLPAQRIPVQACFHACQGPVL